MSDSEQQEDAFEDAFEEEWHVMVTKIEEHIVRIETPSGSGTGFLSHYYGDVRLPGIATASHVVAHARRWHEPIRIHHAGKAEVLKEEHRTIVSNRDAAIIWISKPLEEVEFPEEPVPLLPKGFTIKVGVEVGWLGFPWGSGPVHFFSGKISSYVSGSVYHIDGTTINGVSGGPVFYPDDESKRGFSVIGSISAYIANRATGETLPGLSVAQDIGTLQEMVPDSPEANGDVEEAEEEESSEEIH